MFMRDEGSWWQPFWQLLKLVWVSVRHQPPRLRETAAVCLQSSYWCCQHLVFSFLSFFPFTSVVFSSESENGNYWGFFFFVGSRLKNALPLPYIPSILRWTPRYEVWLGKGYSVCVRACARLLMCLFFKRSDSVMVSEPSNDPPVGPSIKVS